MTKQTVNVNIIAGSAKPVVHVSQYDHDAGALVFNIYDGDTEFSIPSGATIIMQGTKPDKQFFLYQCDGFSGNTVTCSVHDQMTAVAGNVECELRICSGGNSIGTANFTLAIEHAAVADDSVTSADTLTALSEIENTVIASRDLAASSATAAADKASDAASSAKASADNATAAQGYAGKAASSVTEAQGYADSALTAATNAAGYAGEAEYRLMINPESGHMALAHYTKDVAIITVNHSGAWTSTTVNGSTMYAYSVGLSAVYADVPTVSLAASGSNALPTAAEQTAYALVQFATVDASAKKLKLYAISAPISDFVINVEGVAV